MPPKIQFTKADLLRTAFKLTRQQGIAAVNARAIARELGCSTQPIFRAFRSMEDIKREVMRMSMDLYGMYVTRNSVSAERPYRGSGMAYILFARDEPELFKLLFMRDRTDETPIPEAEDSTLDYVLDLVMKSTGLDRDTARQFHRHLRVYTHGLAVMIATHYISLDSAEAEQLLSAQYLAIRYLFGLAAPAEATGVTTE